MNENREAHAARAPQKPRTGWWVGLLLIVAAAAAVWFGVYPHYRYRLIAAVMLGVGVLVVVKRDWWWWLTLTVLFGMVLFLWCFGASGYKYTSLLPLCAATLVVIFRFGGRAFKITAAAVAAVGLMALLIVEIPIYRASKSAKDADAGYVIVLGAAVYGTKPSVSLRNRLICALDYLERNPNAKAVVSGGQGDGEDMTEAACMQNWLLEKGIAEERILLEEHSTSTLENLAFSKAVIEADGGSADKVAIVSSSYHLYRAKAMAASLGMNAEGLASSDGYPIYMCGMYIREALGVVKMWTFGAQEKNACLASAYAARLR